MTGFCHSRDREATKREQTFCTLGFLAFKHFQVKKMIIADKINSILNQCISSKKLINSYADSREVCTTSDCPARSNSDSIMESPAQLLPSVAYCYAYCNFISNPPNPLHISAGRMSHLGNNFLPIISLFCSDCLRRRKRATDLVHRTNALRRCVRQKAKSFQNFICTVSTVHYPSQRSGELSVLLPQNAERGMNERHNDR